ncbi:hypothetical protein S7S_02765 [Isoalcanivorax pacificus W11-5]|uniref:SPOR domain-containing protein n=1 Tax=Isoalcanivorax pacificus W11-5 TaxID=391936 RepID=A0A0B4XJZ5_9GAMM|nr:SPOR domain-containing protein [Isoalcanivorax pacificus]AJD46975.1 hypothetical protein S7S_02765 [Isoalcanivorax pacificus W11-5]
MRWVFYSLLILNVVYLGWQLLARVAPPAEPARAAVVAAPRQLQLLNEQGGSDRPALPRQALCLVVGPWGERGAAESLQRTLRGLAGPGELRAVPVRKDRLSWVYLPATEDRDAALQQLRELQGRGVDSFIVAEGEDANAISLGYFSSAESARGLQVKMRNAGYPAEVRETWKEITEYWLYYPVPDAGAGERIRQAAAGAGVEMAQAGCATG